MNEPCHIKRCSEEATVLLTLDRPETTRTRNSDHRCWTGHMEVKLCAEHGAGRVHALPGEDWRFYGDVITLRPLP